MKYVSLVLLIVTLPAFADADRKEVTFSAFLDTYYAHGFNRPHNNERSFTTQPQRSDEPSINLGFVDATLAKEKVRGRLALQGGNSVEKNTKNYVDENNWARYIQESYAGVKLGDSTWVDAGIFLGNIGAESWISRDNYTYTRSLNLDYVPYYSQGIRIEHVLSAKETIQFQVLNGWQNMNESNDSKAIGMQYKRMIDEKSTFTYNNFFGDERVVSARDRFRGYHNFIFKYDQSNLWQYLAAVDVGHQSQQTNTGVDLWYASTLTVKRFLSPNRSVSFRAEYYNDRHQANVVTGTQNGFNVLGSSVNYDQSLKTNLLWRTELRGFYAKDEIYSEGANGKNRWDGFLVTSLSWWI